MDDTGNTEISLWERMRPKLVRAGEITRQVSLGILYFAAYMAEAWANAEHPCTRCRHAFPNRELYPMTEYYPDYSYRFCPECCTFLQAEQERVSIETREDRVLRRQLDRAMRHGCKATLTLAEWIETLNHYDRHCAYCLTGPYEAMEHHTPIIQGGGTTVGNCVPACKSCNARKSDHHPDEIYKRAHAVILVEEYLSQRALPQPALPQPTPDAAPEG